MDHQRGGKVRTGQKMGCSLRERREESEMDEHTSVLRGGWGGCLPFLNSGCLRENTDGDE